jgi:uncharacterized protein Yka (UPF0111/DUF47 family)
MLSLKKLFGKDDKFFDLLEGGAVEARTSVELFSRYLQILAAGGAPAGTLDDFIQTQRKEKRIRHTMTEELSRTVDTPLEREDIEALSWALNRIPKQVEKLVERLSIYPGRVPHAAFQRQAELMLQATEAVVVMVKQLRGGTTLEKIREPNERLQLAESEADRVMLTLLKDLYQGPYDTKELVILQALYEMMEQAVDRCRSAGNVIVRIVLKPS